MPHATKTADDPSPRRAAAERVPLGERALPTGPAGHALAGAIATSPRLAAQRQQIMQAFGPRHTGRPATQHGEPPAQLKPVPTLTNGGRIRWYDDQDPLRTLYDSEAECLLHNPQLPVAPSSPFLSGKPVKLFDIRGQNLEAFFENLDARRREQQKQLRQRFAREFDQNPRLLRVALRALELVNHLGEAERVTTELLEHDLDQATQDDRLLRLVIRGWAAKLREVLNHVKYDSLLVSTLVADGWALPDIAAMAPAWGVDLWKLAVEYQADKGVCSTALWARLACAHATLAGQPAAVATFARIVGWASNERVQLANLFGTNAGHCNAAQWAQLACADPALHNQAADVAEFARVPGWTFGHLLTLATRFAQNPHGCTAQEWAQLAAQAGLVDKHTEIVELLAVPGWTPASRLALAGLFGVNAGVCNAVQWAALAELLPVNQHADVAALARIAAWTFSGIRMLARAIQADLAGGRNGTFVAAVAARVANDAHQEALAFASIQHWAQANLGNLAAAFTLNPGPCTATQWAQIASANMALVNLEADVACFARVPGWPVAQLATLASNFAVNAGACNAAEWAQVAAARAGSPAQCVAVTEFARMANWTVAHRATLAQLFGTDPGVCNAQEWAQVAVAHMNLFDRAPVIAEFARIAGWAPAHLATLAGLFGANAGVCNEAQWAALAELLPVNQHADVAALARIAGWSFSGVRMLARAINADLAGGRNGSFVAAVAAQLAADAYENTLTFASIPNWVQLNVCQLAAAFHLNPGPCNARQWAQIAGAHLGLVNLDAEVTCFARLLGWPVADATTLATNFAINAGPCNAAEWVQIAGAYAGSPAQCTAVTEFARMAAWTVGNRATLALLFGTNHGVCNAAEWTQLAGAHLNLLDREAVIAAFARIAGWAPANLVTMAGLFGANAGVCDETQWAQLALAHANLLNQEADVAEFARVAGWAPANLVTMATEFGNNAGARTAAEWAQIAAAHVSLVNLEAKVAGCARIVLGAVPALVLFLNNCGATVSAPSGVALVRELAGRNGASWPLLQQVCLNLPPLPFTVANCLTLVRDHLSLLSVPRIIRRLTVHGLPGGGLAPAAMLNQLQQDMVALNQSMNARNIPGPIQNEVRIAFQLRNWRANQLQQFFGAGAVTPGLTLAANQNPAHWLYLFALHHVAGALPVGGVAAGLGVAQAYGIGNITITQASLDHIREGHTWENFLFTPANINRALYSTLFDVGVSNQDLYNRLHNILANPATVRVGLDVTLGATQIWLLGGPGNPVSTMYYFAPGGYGTRVHRDVLHAMHNNGLF